MVKLVIIAAILPSAAWWWTTDFSQAAKSEPGAYACYLSGDLSSAGCVARSPAYLMSRLNDAHEITEISHWGQSLHD
jgi:hypothetical protein